MKKLTAAQRLIIAIDFKPEMGESRDQVFAKVLHFADKIAESGVYVKFNSILRAIGYHLIDEMHSRGLLVFADLKLDDISETLATDGMFLREAAPELVTVKCTAGKVGMGELKASLPHTEVLGVTLLTTHDDVDAERIFGSPTVDDAVLKFALEAEEAQIDGIICAATEVAMLKQNIQYPFTYNTPAVRPAWSVVEGDDQNPDRVMTPRKAIQAGADRLVIGRPIVRAANPLDAIRRTVEEIEQATAQ